MRAQTRTLLPALLPLLLFASPMLADTFWGCGSSDWGVGPAALFQFDTATGVVGAKYVYSDWSWAMGVSYAPGNLLYVAHNTAADVYSFKIAKVDAASGTILSDTLIRNLTGTDYPILNSLQYHDGKLFAIENNSWGSGYTAGQKRGRVYEIDLDGSGNPASAALGAYVGPYPDGALAYRDGTWYASDWRTDTSSWIRTSTDILSGSFSASASTTPVGLFAGWDFEEDGDLLGVSWQNNFNVYQIDTLTGSATALYDLRSQLPEITMLGGLTAVPVPGAVVLGMVGMALVGWLRRRSAC